MTETRKGGRKPAAGTVGYQRSHRSHVWAKARAAQAKLDKVLNGGVCTREVDQEATEMHRVFYHESITRWGAGALRGALAGLPGRVEASLRLTDAVDALFTVLRGEDREPAAPKAKPTKPEDNPAWSYETSLREAGAVRLAALADLADLKAGIESGEYVTKATVQERAQLWATEIRQRAVVIPARYATQVGEKPADELAAIIVAEMLEPCEVQP